MSLAIMLSRASFGINAPLVTVEVHLSNGLPSMSVVGLASAEVKESRERVRSAILNSGYEFPAKRIIINLGPADLPKSGGRFDLSIALGILIASDQIKDTSFVGFEILGELSLNGELQSVRGVLAATVAATNKNRKILLPRCNAEEASLTNDKSVFCASSLKQVCEGMFDQPTHSNEKKGEEITAFDVSQIKGNQHAKKALLIAASAGHNILFSGSPGSGKTMLAKCFPGILGELPVSEAMEIAAIESVAEDGFNTTSWLKRRFRAPHHNCTVASITGGGRLPIPGEISLAHRGILFLDELPEFSRSVLESLRQPLEDGQLTISRAHWKVNFPARFQLVAAMNPCPCGYFASKDRECHCSSIKIINYLGKISGPLLDRIDLQVVVNNPKVSLIDKQQGNNETSASYKRIVESCRALQIERQGVLNSELNVKDLLQQNILSKSVIKIFNQAIRHYHLSMRAQQKVLRVARTISDLEQYKAISDEAIVEALSYRAFDQLFSKARDFI